jgi:PKHD-type hydroxylase
VLFVVEDVLSPVAAAAVRDLAADLDFADGAATAGRYAREVKANAQARPCAALDGVLENVRRALAAHEIFGIAARPRQFSTLILSRYRAGQTYGLHVDDALMGGIRTDLSFTLFLSEPESYDGGSLVIEDTFEARAIRLKAGEMILYPSNTLHRVEPVTRGERLAVVGWVQSWIRDPGQREILFDLERSLRGVFAEQGKTELFDTLAKTRSNLLRMWADG